jgi:hypothetical protein
VGFAPILGEDVVNIHILSEEDRVVEFLTGTEILRTFLHQKRIDALISRRKAHPHRL